MYTKGHKVLWKRKNIFRINSDFFLLVTLSFSVSNTGLITQRTLNNSFFMFVGGLLGAVFGLLGSVAATMVLTESVVEKINTRFKKVVENERLKFTRKQLQDFFQRKIFRQKTEFTNLCSTSRIGD